MYIYLYRSICLFMYVHYLFFQECDDDSLDWEKKTKTNSIPVDNSKKTKCGKRFPKDTHTYIWVMNIYLPTLR